MSEGATVKRRPLISDIALCSQSDCRLVDLTRAGHPQAFGELTRRHRKALLKYTRRIVGRDQADDVVQQSLFNGLRALRKEDAAEVDEPLRWLYRICHNQSINFLKARREHTQLDDSFEGMRQPAQIVEDREQFSILIKNMNKLPERQRTNLALQVFGGLSYSEVAEQMNESIPTVRNLISRARAGLREGFAGLIPFRVVDLVLARTAGVAGDPVMQSAAGSFGRGTAALVAVGTLALGGGALVVDKGKPHSKPNPPQVQVAQVPLDKSGSALVRTAGDNKASARTVGKRTRVGHRRDVQHSRPPLVDGFIPAGESGADDSWDTPGGDGDWGGDDYSDYGDDGAGPSPGHRSPYNDADSQDYGAGDWTPDDSGGDWSDTSDSSDYGSGDDRCDCQDYGSGQAGDGYRRPQYQQPSPEPTVRPNPPKPQSQPQTNQPAPQSGGDWSQPEDDGPVWVD